MQIKDFKLERYFGIHEFSAKYLLSSSDCDGFRMQEVLDLASDEERALWENLQLGYTESEGSPLLREAIRPFYKNADLDNILVASPGELNFVLMNTLLTKADHVVAIAPSYQSLYEVARTVGCEMSFWHPDTTNWAYQPEKLADLMQANTKLIILNFPHNPTGSYLTEAALLEIVAIARKHGSYIFSDEMYHKLLVGDLPELPPVQDVYEKGISLWGTSKTFGLAGLRTGWLVSQDKEVLRKILAFKDYLSICSSAPSEVLSIIGLNHIDYFLSQNIAKIKANIACFTDFATSHQSLISFTPPRAGSTAFVKLHISETALAFSDKMVAETGIMTLPAEMFDYDGKYIRIGFGRANMPEILERFGAYLKQNYE